MVKIVTIETNGNPAPARKQQQRIQDSTERVLSGARLTPDAPIVGAGVGRFLVASMAAQMGRPYIDIGTLVKGPAAVCGRAANCFPAVAVAVLAQRTESA